MFCAGQVKAVLKKIQSCFFIFPDNKDSEALMSLIVCRSMVTLYEICCMPVCAGQENLAGAIQG